MTLIDVQFYEVIEKAKSAINELAKKGVAYVVGLYAYLYSQPDYDEDNIKNNVINSLKQDFKKINADKIYQEIKERFSNIEKSIKDAKEKVQLWNEARNLLKNYSEIIQNEIQNRFEILSQKEKHKKVLSIVCAIIKSIEIKDKKYPMLEVKHDSEYGFIEVRSDEKYFAEIISSVLGRDVKASDVGNLFCKYLLGFQSNSRPKKFVLKISPYAKGKVEELAREASNYVKIPKESEVKSKIKKLYKNKEFLKLTAIECALSTNKKFFSDVFGITYEKLREIKVRRIINRGYVNPLVYEHVEKAMNNLRKEALKELKQLFKKIFKKERYICKKANGNEDCIFTKPQAKPIYMHLSPWARYIEIPKEMPSESIKVIVIQGTFEGMPLQIPETYKEFVWLFLDKQKRKINVALNTYRKSKHRYLLFILENYKFSMELIAPYIKKSKDSKDILEDIAARVLQDLGFSVKICDKVKIYDRITRKEEKIEIDVQGEKRIKDTIFIVYSSCKNQDKDNPVDSDTVKKEIGRVIQLPYEPHIKILATSFIKDSAKDEARRNGFLVIEIGEKVREDNSSRVYLKLYETFNELFSRVDTSLDVLLG
jgi:hypothetical protein